MAPIYLGKMVVPSSLRYIENLASRVRWSEYQVRFRSLCLECVRKCRYHAVGPIVAVSQGYPVEKVQRHLNRAALAEL